MNANFIFLLFLYCFFSFSTDCHLLSNIFKSFVTLFTFFQLVNSNKLNVKIRFSSNYYRAIPADKTGFDIKEWKKLIREKTIFEKKKWITNAQLIRIWDQLKIQWLLEIIWKEFSCQLNRSRLGPKKNGTTFWKLVLPPIAGFFGKWLWRKKNTKDCSRGICWTKCCLDHWEIGGLVFLGV